MRVQRNRIGAGLLAVGMLAGLTACGPFMILREGKKLFIDKPDTAEQMAKKRDDAWTALWPQLQDACRQAADKPATQMPGAAQATVVFDSSDVDLMVPPDVTNHLAVRQVRWEALKHGKPADADALVYWTSEQTRKDDVVRVDRQVIRVDDRGGKTLARDTQFKLTWLNDVHPEYLRCTLLLKPAGQHPVGTHTPDFTVLDNVFGTKG